MVIAGSFLSFSVFVIVLQGVLSCPWSFAMLWVTLGDSFDVPFRAGPEWFLVTSIWSSTFGLETVPDLLPGMWLSSPVAFLGAGVFISFNTYPPTEQIATRTNARPKTFMIHTRFFTCSNRYKVVWLLQWTDALWYFNVAFYTNWFCGCL